MLGGIGPQHQEAESEQQAVGQGAYGGRRGRVRLEREGERLALEILVVYGDWE